MSDNSGSWSTALANKIVPILIFVGIFALLGLTLVNPQAIKTIHAIADEGIRVIHSLKGC